MIPILVFLEWTFMLSLKKQEKEFHKEDVVKIE